MKDAIEARIAQLRAELESEEQKLQSLVESIPAEFHQITREVYEKLKVLFG